MKTNFFRGTLALLAAFVAGYTTPHGLTQKTGVSPFVVSVVPAWSGQHGRGISMARDIRDVFYVLLTNTSQDAQMAFLASNSWGYYAVSFEMQLTGNEAILIRKKPQLFSKNTPAAFLIPPGEQMVYPIKLDDEWEATSPLPIADETPVPVAMTAIYKLDATPESARQKIWVGRAQSAVYHFYFRHWVERPSAN